MKRMIILFTMCLLTIGIVSSKSVTAVKEKKKQKVSPGIEVLLEEEKNVLSGKKVGLITNPTGIDSKLTSIVDLLNDDPDINLTALFGPEHGVRGDAQAGASVEYYIDEKTGLPVYSLYGKTKKPTPEMLKDVEVLVFDIQDVGTRYYTYIYTMAYAMEAAKENDIPFIVLDRPNPQGGESVDGPVLEPEFSSFVGLYPIPLKHGMTVGELATLFNKEFNIGADLKVIKMKGWKRDMDYDDTGLPFVLPSPNMPAVSTTFVYPATGLIEGTNVSEGRGTTKPFELIGAPYINSDELAGKLNALRLPGVKFRAASFTPTFSKHAGKLSHGVEIYITDREEFKAVPTGLHIIKTIQDLYPGDFEFLAANNFNLLIGNGWVMSRIEDGSSVNEIMKEYQVKQDAFKKVRKNYLLYK
ncbi:exo-beta-N-acetylmuramidase NamZ domain-containing protein [Peribacillus sp. NPDC096622]|uniref:exo-beta-N-acetylmuramidase NamZ family protein n=1 Tax=Peribacillus sp. NPDC096622 TaxID=3364396 RepID=UPI003808F36F